jgi:hypothetical protein
MPNSDFLFVNELRCLTVVKLTQFLPSAVSSGFAHICRRSIKVNPENLHVRNILCIFITQLSHHHAWEDICADFKQSALQ